MSKNQYIAFEKESREIFSQAPKIIPVLNCSIRDCRISSSLGTDFFQACVRFLVAALLCFSLSTTIIMADNNNIRRLFTTKYLLGNGEDADDSIVHSIMPEFVQADK
jgi:hypothetical protein